MFSLDIYNFLSSYLKFFYAEKAKLYLCKNYFKLIETERFLSIEIDLLIDILKNSNLDVNSEFEIFESVIKWISFDFDNRCIYVKDLLALVRTSSLKSLKITNYLNQIECDDLKIQVGSYIFEKFESQIHTNTVKFEEPRKYLRKSILIIGGITNALSNTLNNRIYCFDTVNLRIFSISNSFLTRSNHCICELNDLVFISGGEIDLAISDLVEIFDLDYFRQLINNYCSNVLQHDSKTEEPSVNNEIETNIKIQHLNQARTDFGMCTIDDKLYVFGGWIGSWVGDTVECYSPIENTWFTISTLQTLRYEFACVSLINSNFIYLIGGTSTFDTKLSLVERFDVSANKWQSCQSMNEKRSGCSCTIVNERIYVIGGYNGKNVLKSCEVYDPINVG